MPELKVDSAPPVAVQRVSVPYSGKIFWTLRAVYPEPYSTVWVRYWESDNDEYIDILTASGQILQRVRLVTSAGQEPPVICAALYLEPRRQRGPLLYIKSSSLHHFYALPEGFSGFFSESDERIEFSQPLRFTQDHRGFVLLQLGKERRHWSGVRFAEGTEGPDIVDGTAPVRLPLAPTKEKTRFATAIFDRVYFVRWVTKGEKAILEVMEKAGKCFARYPLRDTFGASQGWSQLSAVWVDDRRKRTPAIIVRDSDQVRVHVFGDGLRTLLAVKDFNDSSSSISATTVSFGRDKKGLLTVTEAYSERGDENGNGGDSHDTNYRWTGRDFVETH
jgi:hypothetical protein